MPRRKTGGFRRRKPEAVLWVKAHGFATGMQHPAPESSKQGAKKSFRGGHMASVELETLKAWSLRRQRRRGSRRRSRRRGGEWGRGYPQPTRGSGGASYAPPAGSRAEPRRKTILMLSKRIRTPLVATFVEN